MQPIQKVDQVTSVAHMGSTNMLLVAYGNTNVAVLSLPGLGPQQQFQLQGQVTASRFFESMPGSVYFGVTTQDPQSGQLQHGVKIMA